MQPLRCQAVQDGEAIVELRCPECHTRMQGAYSKQDVETLDRLHAAWRQELVTEYERSVAESMESLIVCLSTALELDLVGPDDFAVPPRRKLRAA